MAGHSKWANIKRQKARVDAAKGKTFAKLSREIIVAARSGVPDPNGNFRLRTAIEKAKAAGIPNDNIDRAIAKGSGQFDSGGDNLEEIRYEGYGPSGVAVLMEILTDNRNRTAADVREAFSKTGGNLGETGCVSWMFDQRGVVRISGDLDEEELLLTAAEAGGDDVLQSKGTAEVICDYTELESVTTQLEKAGLQVKEASIRWLPNNMVKLDEADVAKQVLKLMDKLDALDDVQNVFANFEIEDEILEEIAS